MGEDLVIHKIFAQVSSRFPDRVCLQIKKGPTWERWTYGQTEDLSLRIGAFLINEGFKKGDFAAICIENRPEWAIIYLGIMAAGLTCVPLDPQLSEQETENLISDCGAKIIFVSNAIFQAKSIHKIKGQLNKIVILDLDIEKGRLLGLAQVKPTSPEGITWPEVIPEDMASLVYTSGTTGRPKGVMLTHKNFCSNFQSIDKLRLITDKDNLISILPLHHSYPFMVTLITPLFCRARVTYTSSFRSDELLGCMREAGVTILVGVPQLFYMLYIRIMEGIKKIPFFVRMPLLGLIEILWQIRRYSGINLSKSILSKIHRPFGLSLRFFACGGAKLNEEAAGLFVKMGFTILEGYGLTETSPVVTFNPLKKQKIGSAGKAIPDVELKIDDPDGEGIGEVVIKGPNVMKGYYKREEETLSVLKDGWFYSGDLGVIDKDGYLFITGREKEVIVLSSGKNIYPEELEAYYSQSPYIKEICVLQKSEEQFGHLIDSLFAVAVPDLEYFQQKNIMNIRTKIRWELENLAKDLPGYRRIMGFTLAKEALARTAMGKIKRYEVREKYLLGKPASWETEEAGLWEEDKIILSQDFAQKTMRYLSGQLKKPVYLDSHLEIDLGIDSLTRVELVLGLEALLSLKIPDEVVYDVPTVRDLIMRIQEIIQYSKPYQAKIIQKSWAEILRGEPKEEILQKIRIKPRIIDWILTYIFMGSFKFMFRILWLLRIRAVGNLPKDGPYLICPNHASFLDGFVVFSSLPLKSAINTYFVGFSYILEYPLFKWALKLARLLPINPNINLTDAMQAASYLLTHKKIVCIFPEGLRSVDEKVNEFKKGVGILIKELDAPVVPVYIKGSHQSWPRTKSLPRPHPIKITFGRSFDFEELKEKGLKLGAKDDYEAIALGVREEVIKLKGEQ
ncbi:MAG: AMP-binding protein [Candidatus Omnitrophica bacterium]|nr:AMP-binding protein [Candidatus Omnitrophota bacterium]